MLHKTPEEENSILVKSGEFFPAGSTVNSGILEVSPSARARDIDFSVSDTKTIVILVPAFTDGRAFSLASQLRTLGFKGIIRVRGPIFADQYPLALRCGIDEVEISRTEAARQPQNQWLEAMGRKKETYLERLGNSANITTQG